MNLRRLLQAKVCLVQDVDSNAEKQHRIEGGGQYLEPVIPECPALVSGAFADSDGSQCDSQCGCVGEHMSSVGDKRQALSDDAADQLND